MKSNFYIISLTLFLIFISFNTCKKDKKENNNQNQLQGGNITYVNNILTVPSNATIVYKGITYSGTATLPSNTLIGIVQNNNAYLYFTSMGNAKLSDSTSRRAVGYFLFCDTNFTKKLKKKKSSNNGIDLPTGINVVQSGQSCTFTNDKKRFAAITNQGNTQYLTQRGDLIDIDWVGALSGKNLIDVLQCSYVTMPVNTTVATYGATIRLLPIAFPLSAAAIVQKNLDALNAGADKIKLAQVNLLDLSYFIIQGIESIASNDLPPILDCASGFVVTLLGDEDLAALTALITNGTDATKNSFNNTIQDGFNTLISCLITEGVSAVAGVGFAGLTVKKFLDIVGQIGWIIDNTLVSGYDIYTTSAYCTWTPGVVLPPNLPYNINPGNGAANQPTSLTLSWLCTDPQGYPLYYDVHFGTSSNPPLVTTSPISSTTYNPGILNSNTTYYWQIVAYDNQGNFTASNVWSFTTAKVQPPVQPYNPVPANNATNVIANIAMSWQCYDEQGNPLTYDVYMGTNNNPPKVTSSPISTNTFTPSKLNNNTNYYWKVVVYDNGGNTVAGDLWNFKTGNSTPPPGNVIMPLATGNTWTYQNESGGSQAGTTTNTITGTQTISNTLCYVENTQTTGQQNGTTDLVNESNGIWCYGMNGSYSYNELMWKYPANVGDSWISNWMTDTISCVSTNASFSGYSGCYEYHYKIFGMMDYYTYFKPGLGQIAIETYLEGVLEASSTLVSYKLY